MCMSHVPYCINMYISDDEYPEHSVVSRYNIPEEVIGITPTGITPASIVKYDN